MKKIQFEHLIDENIRFKDLVGLTIVGYRYGEAPESGYSYNTATQRYEAGVSMASVGYQWEIASFAVGAYEGKNRHYYIGEIAEETGGDDEVTLNNVRKISRAEYLKLLPEYAETSNKIANVYYNRTANMASRGWLVDLDRSRERRDTMLKKAAAKTIREKNKAL